MNETSSSFISDNKQLQFKKFITKSLVAGVFGFGLMISAGVGVIPEITENSNFWFTVGLLTSFVMWFSAREFFIRAWIALKRHDTTGDTLIVVAIVGAWLYSMFVVFLPSFIPPLAQPVYFDMVAIIICLVNLVLAFEFHVNNKVSHAIERLTGLQTKTAVVIREGIATQVSTQDIAIGETLRVVPGEIIAVDGEIVEGETTIDESMLIGESSLEKKSPGDTVIAGSINKTESFLFISRRIAKDTLLSQIIAMLRRPQSSKPAVSSLVDKTVVFFVPGVMIISLITFVLWASLGITFGVNEPMSYAIVSALTVLVIAYPGAFKQALPIANSVAIDRAANSGILFRHVETLQETSKLDLIVLDKTGTITQGKPDVVAVHTAENIDVTELLQAAASVNVQSEHPLARAIVLNAKEQDIALNEIAQFNAISGKGVSAYIGENIISVGNDMLMKDQCVDIEQFAESIETLTTNGVTPVYVARNKQLLGIIGLADPIKADSKAAVHRFIRKGLLVVMLSGDNKDTTHAIATQVGITQVIAPVLPEHKVEHIEKLKRDGLAVAVVSNDVPALVSAQVGFALASASEQAFESADINLMRGSLCGVADAIDLSCITSDNIRKTMLAAFIYNSIGLPLAAGIFYPLLGVLLPPIYAGIAMALASFIIINHANRLPAFKQADG